MGNESKEQSPQSALATNKLWMTDKEARETRALLLSDWDTSVQPETDKATSYVGHSVTYGSTALQAAYILNGGALAALPAMMSALKIAGTSAIANAAIPFILGIAATAISSLCAYYNFQCQAQMSWHDANAIAANIRAMYAMTSTPPLATDRKKWEWRVNTTFFIGVASGICALVFFVWGSWQFIELARAAAKH